MSESLRVPNEKKIIWQNSNYLKDISKVLSGNLLSQLLVFLGLPLLSRIFTPSDFAIQNLFIQLLGFTTVFLSWRYEYLIVLPKNEVTVQALKYLVMFTSFIVFIIGGPLIWIFRPYIVQILHVPELYPYLPWLIPSAGLVSFAVVSQNIAQREKNFHLSSIAEVISKIVYVTTALLGGALLNGPLGLIICSGTSAFSKIVWIEVSLKRKPVKKPIFHFKDIISALCEYRNLATSISISHFLMAITATLPSFFIAYKYGNQILGQYAMVATTLFLPTYLIASSLGQVFYQRAAALWIEKKRFLDLWNKTTCFLLLAGIPIYLSSWLLAERLYPFILGDNWSIAGSYASILMPAAFMCFLSSPFERSCLVVGSWRYPLIWHFFRATSMIILALLAYFYQWNIEGFLSGLNIQMILCFLIDFHFQRFFTKFSPFR